MLKKALIGLAVVVAVLLAVVATRPESFHVERTTLIAAPAQVVFDQINDFHNWGGWSPWDHLDPNQKKTYSGSPMGAGAQYAWAGNDKVGEGNMTIVEAKAPEIVKIKLDFIKPFPAKNDTAFTLAATGVTVKVVWSMDGAYDFMGKAASIFMDMDSMIGKDFEAGLASLRTIAEARAKKDAAEAAARAAAAAAAAAPPPAPSAP